MERLAETDGLLVRQQREMTEVFTGWETANRYVVSDTAGEQIYGAAEIAGNFLMRQWLKSYRPFALHVAGFDGITVMNMERPFRFINHMATIEDGAGGVLGSIQKRFNVLERRYDVRDPSGSTLYELQGPLLRPWTFHLLRNGTNIGRVSKQWSGLLKEAFTDADHFGVTYPRNLHPRHKMLLLGAVFLIDFVHFERGR